MKAPPICRAICWIPARSSVAGLSGHATRSAPSSAMLRFAKAVHYASALFGGQWHPYGAADIGQLSDDSGHQGAERLKIGTGRNRFFIHVERAVNLNLYCVTSARGAPISLRDIGAR